MWLVQRRVINHQHTLGHLNQRSNFLPKRFAIRGQALQKPRLGIMRWPTFLRRVCLRYLNIAKELLRCRQKVDVIQVSAFRRVHASSLAFPPSTA